MAPTPKEGARLYYREGGFKSGLAMILKRKKRSKTVGHIVSAITIGILTPAYSDERETIRGHPANLKIDWSSQAIVFVAADIEREAHLPECGIMPTPLRISAKFARNEAAGLMQ